MTVQLGHDLEQFVNDQVASGRFESADAVLSAAVARLMLDHYEEADEELDAEDQAAVDEADREYAAGLCRPWREVSAELRRDFPEL